MMEPVNILGDDFAQAAAEAGLHARTEALTAGKADAALAASIFHYGTHTLAEAKSFLKERGVADDVKDRILHNMSERGAQMLVEEMQFQPPQRKRDIEEAQGRVVAIVRKLEEAGAVVLSRSDEDVVF